jgi:hypothetical protein
MNPLITLISTNLNPAKIRVNSRNSRTPFGENLRAKTSSNICGFLPSLRCGGGESWIAQGPFPNLAFSGGRFDV